jgi:hypothetical protein
MQFEKPSQWLRLWARPALKISPAQTSLALIALACVVFVCGCAGSVTATSSGAFSVSGSIAPASNGNGATITLSGPSTASTTANSSGSFSFGGLTNGNYALTPNRTGYVFTPAVQTLAINGASVSGVNFSAAVLSTDTVLLNWQASTSPVSGYNVYRSTANGGPYTRVNGTLVTSVSYTDSSLASSTTYYYVATAVSSAGVESDYSNQTSAQIP